MFTKKNLKQPWTTNIVWQSTWFTQTPKRYRCHIYEDLFLRKYITSFFFKWSKFSTFKVIGTIQILRTFGKLLVKVSFFYPSTPVLNYVTKAKLTHSSKNFRKVPFLVKNVPDIQPLMKCRKQLWGVYFFYKLEEILGVQVFFKFTNICNPFFKGSNQNALVLEATNILLTKLTFFRNHFKFNLYCLTINFCIHLFKFSKPDSLLFANYVSQVLRYVQRHTYFLVFLKKVLQVVHRIFKFRGIRILLTGKLNSLPRAQTKQIQIGSVPLQTIATPFTQASAVSFTRAGKIGVTLWIC